MHKPQHYITHSNNNVTVTTEDNPGKWWEGGKNLQLNTRNC